MADPVEGSSPGSPSTESRNSYSDSNAAPSPKAGGKKQK